ncbi:phosphoribosylamine--glycine ligase [Gulosibacter bifidus]|uniref:Multifunctional fusion protein n=1 Tax=Gulosibacter bifidus TaxID=272239 RepID=A0ABW5RJD8_9MICO|nr:phosphoribosylamine--glycine ligase [Gulosibacter bifidus]
MKILVLGSGAREHAIVHSLAQENAHQLVVAPGNTGIAREAERIRIDQSNPDLIAEFVKDEAIDLVVIGPEAPLVAGVADAVRELGMPVFGPSKAAAQLEGSKTFAKDVMQRAGVPTGRAVRLTDLAEVAATLDQYGAPYVIKADGLASGKGVIVTEERDAALRHAEVWLPHGPVLVEEFLDGQEVSLFCITDGETVRALPPAQDFKRLNNNDAGPNTGGMGAYTPVPFLIDQFGGEREFMRTIEREVAQPIVDTMRADGVPFQGLLYCGLIVNHSAIRVIEFNARFGDPETQVVLQRLTEPLSELLLASANGTLDQHAPELSLNDKSFVTVVLASEGYPEQVRSGREITGLEDAEATGALVLHAATAENDGVVTATGGRVLNVVAGAESLQEARRNAYTAMDRIRLEGGQFRTDIAQAGAALQDVIRARTGAMAAVAEAAPAPAVVQDAPAQLDGWRHVYSGKVREIYESDADASALLVVASNRVSAFDHLLEPEIPGKGAMLNELSRFWFSQLPVANHLREDAGWDAALSPELAARAMRVAKLEMYPIECVVRGYLTGSGFAEYERTGAICGVPLPAGMQDGDRLPAPIYTPAYKAPQGEHDENITYEQTVELVGEQVAARLRDVSLRLFTAASTIAAERGLVLADTKFEFGHELGSDEVVLADEVLTSDSSRFWDAASYRDESLPLNERLASFDKQIVRNWLKANWNGEGVPPVLPASIVAQTQARYRELIDRLTR